eukprot:CAMPEP_0206612164 /NCGR_PEP_ID=MMETSP0325_2-20121206/55792_1 /ASSEMBLY_ACC=CAM_ASM_000347 /TAXON_ID=2866 /ORGANISM="Crypthecodinium cohnii, Strain Seligo" /LENGTH=804 /DNA_ID=CAMNT_0054131735 /DNA_START=199 /DNA_END=2611 /DNA_ORIENTATION=+
MAVSIAAGAFSPSASREGSRGLACAASSTAVASHFSPQQRVNDLKRVRQSPPGRVANRISPNPPDCSESSRRWVWPEDTQHQVSGQNMMLAPRVPARAAPHDSRSSPSKANLSTLAATSTNLGPSPLKRLSPHATDRPENHDGHVAEEVFLVGAGPAARETSRPGAFGGGVRAGGHDSALTSPPPLPNGRGRLNGTNENPFNSGQTGGSSGSSHSLGAVSTYRYSGPIGANGGGIAGRVGGSGSGGSAYSSGKTFGAGLAGGGGSSGSRCPPPKAGPPGPHTKGPLPPNLSRSKLVLHYVEGENPMADLVRLGGGQGTDVLVEAVAENSKAERAGVKAGFALVALNGRTEFVQLPGWQVRLLLDAPITLGFDPEPVKPQSMKCTEIRLTRAQDVLGIPPRVAVFGPRDQGVLADEVTFNPGAAPLFISAWSNENVSSNNPEVGATNSRSLRRVYELRRPEAHAIVGRAIRGARALSPDLNWDDDDDDESRAGGGGSHSHSQSGDVVGWQGQWYRTGSSSGSRSHPALCSLDCVAECVDHDLVVEQLLGGPTQPKKISNAPPVAPRRPGSGQDNARTSNFMGRAAAATQQQQQQQQQSSPGHPLSRGRPLRRQVATDDQASAGTNTPSTVTGATTAETSRTSLPIPSVHDPAYRQRPAAAPRSPSSSKLSPRLGSGQTREAGGSRSPLRWLEPVLGPILGALSALSPRSAEAAAEGFESAGRVASSFGPRALSPRHGSGRGSPVPGSPHGPEGKLFTGDDALPFEAALQGRRQKAVQVLTTTTIVVLLMSMQLRSDLARFDLIES